MNRFNKRSRVTKALIESGAATSFDAAEARLDSVEVCVCLGADQANTPAGQAAALTAVAASFKCFGRVTFVTPDLRVPLRRPLFAGQTLGDAVRWLGALSAEQAPADVTHVVQIGRGETTCGWTVRCWWDRWLAGTRCFDDPLGDPRMPLAGVFAGALAVRQVFATVLKTAWPADTTVSVWEPWADAANAGPGPDRFDAPTSVWLLGLGHLGQAFAWSLSFLPYKGCPRAVVQDDQEVAEENEPTSLLVTPEDIGKRKTLITSRWLRSAGWRIDRIERRNYGDVNLQPGDPPFLLGGLDRLQPRLAAAGIGFDYMIDAGIGNGPGDFEGLQIRVIPAGASLEGLWGPPPRDKQVQELMAGNPAYKDLEAKIGECGTFMIADASVAVPFVGAAAGALAIAQLLRLGSLLPATQMLQMELGAPSMILGGGLCPAAGLNKGSEPMRLDSF
jgi:hypothetical protein